MGVPLAHATRGTHPYKGGTPPQGRGRPHHTRKGGPHDHQGGMARPRRRHPTMGRPQTHTSPPSNPQTRSTPQPPMLHLPTTHRLFFEIPGHQLGQRSACDSPLRPPRTNLGTLQLAASTPHLQQSRRRQHDPHTWAIIRPVPITTPNQSALASVGTCRQDRLILDQKHDLNSGKARRKPATTRGNGRGVRN